MNREPSSGSRPAQQADLVLIVDDELSITETIELLVQEAGYHTLVAHNGQEALAHTERCWPALVISDVMMPMMDGPKFIAALRARAGTWQLPMPVIVLMSATSRRAIESVGADLVISKPFDIAILEAALHALMNGSAPHQPPSSGSHEKFDSSHPGMNDES